MFFPKKKATLKWKMALFFEQKNNFYGKSKTKY